MARRRRKKEDPGAPAWMVTYSDMVTLLLTFFVLLLSMSRLDKIKFQDAAGSLKGAFGVLQSSDKSEIAKPKVVEFAPIDDDYVTRLYQKIMADLHRLKLDEDIQLVKDRGAVILRIREAILFPPGSTTLSPQAHPVLRKVAGLVKPLPLNLRIEGHTDSTPAGQGEATNWDLSAMRALSVLKFLAQEELLPIDRMSAVGYGEQRPIAPNDTPESRALNRRVEFVMESLGDYREELPYLIDARDQLPF